MSFTNIKNNNQGFTIVELLIVVVVIAILAAITIVSYNGITNKANASAAASTAASLQKKAELYSSDDDGGGNYPNQLTLLTNSAKSAKPYYIATGTIKTSATAPDSSNGKNTVMMEVCGTPAGTANATSKTVVTGLKITYFTFPGTSVINVGDTSVAGNCAPAPAA